MNLYDLSRYVHCAHVVRISEDEMPTFFFSMGNRMELFSVFSVCPVLVVLDQLNMAHECGAHVSLYLIVNDLDKTLNLMMCVCVFFSKFWQVILRNDHCFPQS